MNIEFVIIDNDCRRFRCSVRGLFETIYDQKNEPICLPTALADALTITFRMMYRCMVDFSPQPLLQGRVFNFIQARLHLLNPNLGLQQHSNYQFIHIPGLPNYQSGHHYTLQDLKLVCGYQNIADALKKHFGPWGPRYPLVAGVKMHDFVDRRVARLAWDGPPFRRPGDRGKELVVVDLEEEMKLANEVGHAIIITGLDTSSLYEEEHIVEIKNSWGPKWGKGGYSKVTYHFIESLYIPVLRGGRVEEVDKHRHPLELNTLIGHENSINGICFSDDGYRLATACDDAAVRIFHMENFSNRSFKCTKITMPKITMPKVTTPKAARHPSPVASADDDASVVPVVPTAVAFADDDTSVVVACKSAARKGSFFHIYGKDNLRGDDDSPQFHFKKEISEVHYHMNIVTLYGAKVAGVNGSTMLVSSSEGTDIRVWEGKSGERVGSVDTNQGKNNMATISPDGRYIAAATLGRDVKVWKIKYGLDACSALQRVTAVTKVKTLIGHKGDVTWLCFTPNSNEIISASVDGTIRVWNIDVAGENVSESNVLKKTPTPQDLKKTRLHYDRLAISPDGKILAVSQKSVLQWLSFETGEVLDTADGAHEGDITSITWAPKPIRVGDKDVSVLATLSADKKMKLWIAPAL